MHFWPAESKMSKRLHLPTFPLPVETCSSYLGPGETKLDSFKKTMKFSIQSLGKGTGDILKLIKG